MVCGPRKTHPSTKHDQQNNMELKTAQQCAPNWQGEEESRLPTIGSDYQDEGNKQKGQRCPTMESVTLVWNGKSCFTVIAIAYAS